MQLKLIRGSNGAIRLCWRLLRGPRAFRKPLLYEWIAGANRQAAEGTVAVTFDDGPHPSSTPFILDILATAQAPATFFITGKNAEMYPDLVGRIVTEGHSLGSHGEVHFDARERPWVATRGNYEAATHSLEVISGRSIALYRPPHGGLTLRFALFLRRQRTSVWFWTIDPEDWRADVGSGQIIQAVSGVGNGDVILLHDWIEEPESVGALDRASTIAALPAILETIRSRGLCPVALSSRWAS